MRLAYQREREEEGGGADTDGHGMDPPLREARSWHAASGSLNSQINVPVGYNGAERTIVPSLANV